MHSPDAHFIGVDVGGTKVAAGLVNSNGKISQHIRVPMPASDAAAALAAVTSAIDGVRHAIDQHAIDVNEKPLVSGSESVLPARFIRTPASSLIRQISRRGETSRSPAKSEKFTNCRFASITTATPRPWPKLSGVRDAITGLSFAQRWNRNLNGNRLQSPHLSWPHRRRCRGRAQYHRLSRPALRMRQARLHRGACFRSRNCPPRRGKNSRRRPLGHSRLC